MLAPFQKDGVSFLTQQQGGLLADQPGTGKTLQMIETVKNLVTKGDILVLAPMVAAHVSWPEELAKWTDDEVIIIKGGKATKERLLSKVITSPPQGRRWIVANFETARVRYFRGDPKTGTKPKYEEHFKDLFQISLQALIIDESHLVLPTDKTKLYKQTLVRRGIMMLGKKTSYRFAMSGTPFRGKLENLWGTLDFLSNSEIEAYWTWVNRWFITRPKEIYTKSRVVQQTEILGLNPLLKEDFSKQLEPVMIRRKKLDVFPELPPKRYAGSVRHGVVGHWIDLTPKQKSFYKQMKELALTRLASGTLIAQGVLAELTRLKQFASVSGDVHHIQGEVAFTPALPSNKFDWFVDFLTERGIIDQPEAKSQEDSKVVVASQFSQVLDLFEQTLLDKYDVSCWKITGEVSSAKRAEAVEDFQKESAGKRIMLLNTKSGGVALTLDRADELVILDETFIPDDQEQVEDRIHRVSRIHNVIMHYVRSKGTIEETIAKKVQKREELQKQILDGSYDAKQLLT